MKKKIPIIIVIFFLGILEEKLLTAGIHSSGEPKIGCLTIGILLCIIQGMLAFGPLSWLSPFIPIFKRILCRHKLTRYHFPMPTDPEESFKMEHWMYCEKCGKVFKNIR